MLICPRCGQADIDEAHQCVPTAIMAEQSTEVRDAVAVLVILVLSIGLFAATLTFTVLHQPTANVPVIIQTTLPANDATATTPAQATPTPLSVTPTTAPATHGNGGAAHSTPTPQAPSPTPATLPQPTASTVPPTPTDTPQPTPTRLPQ